MTVIGTADHAISARLAAFVADASPPEDVRHVARRALATAVPLAAGAVGAAAPVRVLAVARGLGPAGAVSVLGRRERLSAPLAALVNGTSANSDDFDDTDLETLSHPAAATVPAALAAAECHDASFDDLVDATAVGLEVGMRMSRTLGVAHAARGWHISSTAGQLAAAAAAASCLRLPADDIEQALGLAATQAAGLGQALGTMAKPFHFGKAASNGVDAALLVSAGLSAPRRGIEGRRGVLAVAAPHAEATTLTKGLGQRWLALEAMPKPYPCGIVGHPAIDAAVELAGQVQDLQAITAVEAHVHPSCADLMGNPEPRTPLEAKLSVAYCVAAALRRGWLGLADFTDNALTEPAVSTVRERVRLVPESRPMDSARLVVRVADAEFVADVEHARGTPARPLDDEEIAAKGREAAARTLGEDRATALVDACLGRAPCATARGLGAAARPAP